MKQNGLKTAKRRLGDIGENLACVFLEKRGFEILERNYLRKWGEIDIVTKKDGVIRFIEVKDSYKLKDSKINKTWIVHPVLVELKEKPEIKLDWEHTEFRWIKPEELNNYDFVTDLDKTVKKVLF